MHLRALTLDTSVGDKANRVEKQAKRNDESKNEPAPDAKLQPPSDETRAGTNRKTETDGTNRQSLKLNRNLRRKEKRSQSELTKKYEKIGTSETHENAVSAKQT